MREIIDPTMRGMARRGAPYRGVLFAGLMLCDDGPKLIEFNVRFGDPEAEVLLARLDEDIAPLLMSAATGALARRAPKLRDVAALTVIVAARGYPGAPERGSVIRGLDQAEKIAGVSILHAGTARRDGAIVADGGRVLAVTAIGGDVGEARSRAYQAVDLIDWPEGFCRRDIGWRALAREKGA
jgi:phosphoribosylamine--glycine ligase